MLRTMPDQPLDLTSPEVTRVLLRDPLGWRDRAVETLRISSAEFVQRERSLQCRPLFPLVADVVSAAAPASSHAFVVLPLGLLPKQPLLDFHVEGPCDEPVLLRRPDIAEREAALVLDYAQEAGLEAPASLRTFLPQLLGFTEGSWAAVKSSVGPRRDPARVYLESGLSGFLAGEHLERLRAASDRTHRLLDTYNEIAPDRTSAAESPFLVVPVLVEDGYMKDIEQAVAAVEDYAALVESADRLARTQRPSAAGDLLSVLADYGRHWELMVLAEVPLDRPFSVSYRHLDPVGVRGWRNTLSTAVIIADARSNHVSISTSDPGTRLVDVTARHPRSGALAQMGSTSREAREMHAFYVWEVDVDFRVVLSARLDVLGRLIVGNALLALVVLLVTAALVLRAPVTVGELAIVAGPTAAVASLLLLREPSTLASRLRLRYSAVVAISVLALLGVAIWRFTTLPVAP